VAPDIRNGYVTDSVFVSYSRDDSRMATLVVQLLRARDDVFYDIDSIPAGERWRDALLRAIDNASHFYLLWCMHSAGSEEVEWEWQRAISGNKRLVPVLLDSTPLVKPLTDYQWVDFQGVVQWHKPPPPAAPPRARALPRLALAGLSIFAVLVFALFSVDFAAAPIDPPAGPSVWLAVLIAVSVVVVVLALVAFGARSHRRRRRRERATERTAEAWDSEQLAEAIAQDLAIHGRGP
jgi:TIR domain